MAFDAFFDINTISELISDKLPSNIEIIQLFFYNTRDLKIGRQESATLVYETILKYWTDVDIPTRQKSHCVKKILDLLDKWRSFQKSYKSKHQGANFPHLFQEFRDSMENLFDVASADALEQVNVEKQRFLINQRLPGRIGSILDLKKTLQESVDPVQKLDSTLSNITISQEIQNVQSSASDYVPEEKSSSSEASPPQKKSRGTIDICTPKVVAVLDKSKVSDRNAAHLLTAFLEAVNLNVNDYQIARSSIQKKRKIIRKQKFEEIKAEFTSQDLDNLILHWDGKILTDLTGEEKVDRLPIVISYKGITKLLSVPKLQNGTGKAQSEAIFEALENWGISDAVVGFVCDTTASNLGPVNGAAILLEHLLERNVLYFPCRHHILEIVLRSIYEVLIPGTVGPNVPMFERFKNEWPSIKLNQFDSGITDAAVFNTLHNDLEDIEKNIKKNMSLNIERTDYTELLCLSLLFIGVKPNSNYVIKKPGASHHARWMSKAIYALKIFLYRNTFNISKKNLIALQQICIFIVKIYIKYWFVADIPEKAPKNDLNFIKNCHDFKSVNSQISTVAVKKMFKHLWYLSPQNASLSFFDDDVTLIEKRRMVSKLKAEDDINDEKENETKMPTYHVSQILEICESEIEQFISPESLIFFKKLNFSTDWIKDDPENWEQNNDYLKCKDIIKSLKVVNDVAERNVQLFANYNGHLTKDEDQMQYIMHVHESYSKQFLSTKKQDLMGNF